MMTNDNDNDDTPPQEFNFSTHVEKLKDILEKGSERDVSTKMEKVQKFVNWGDFLDVLITLLGSDNTNINSGVDFDYKYNHKYNTFGSATETDTNMTRLNQVQVVQVLHSPLTRNVQVYIDKSDQFHREYTTHNDTILQMALRRSPPNNVLDFFSEVSESYRCSKRLFELINTIHLEDKFWIDVDATLKEIEKEQQMKIKSMVEDTNTDADADTDTDADHEQQRRLKAQAFMKEICEIRHSWREDTLLSVATRRDPPLHIIQKLLSYAPETIHFCDTPRYDWMPFQYSIAYNGKPEVVEALIPNDEIRAETNVLIEKDVYNLTPLLWSLYYGAPVAVVKTLVDADISDGKKSLHVRNNKGEKPFENAITASTDMAIVEILLPPNEKIQDIEAAMLRSVLGLRSMVSDIKEEYTVSREIYHSLAEVIARRPNLQMMLQYMSCESLPTAIMVSECYAKIMFIVAFHNLSKAYLLQQQELEEIEAEQEGPFFRSNVLLDEERVSFILLCIALVYTIFRELHQMKCIGLAYVTSPWNWFDLLFIVLSLCTLLQLGGANLFTFDTGTRRELILITSAVAWANLLFFIRSIFLPFAVFVSGLIGVVSKNACC